MRYSTFTHSSQSFCPSGFGASAWIDLGEPSGVGPGFCTLTSNPLPPPYTPPPTCEPLCGTYPDCRECACPHGTIIAAATAPPAVATRSAVSASPASLTPPPAAAS